MKKHVLRIKTNVNCNIYIDTEYTCSAEANHFAKIELDEGEYMVKIESEADPDDCFNTELYLDKDQLIKATLKVLSDTDHKNDPPIAVANNKNAREDDLAKKINAMCPMVAIPGGTFYMGEDESDDRHQVTLSPYQIGKYEVTQELWDAVMGDNYSAFKGAQKPVTNVSWHYCQEFIKKLNQITGKEFRLPTEAEWEFAARGGVSEKSSEYSGSNNLYEVGWYEDNSDGTTHDVGVKRSNIFGLYDMSGNVKEWCLDWYGYYSEDSVNNPIGPKDGYDRVTRGGSWRDSKAECSIFERDWESPEYSHDHVGFRLCMGHLSGNHSGRTEVIVNNNGNKKKINWELVGKWVLVILIAILIIVFGEALGIPRSVLYMLKNIFL